MIRFGLPAGICFSLFRNEEVHRLMGLFACSSVMLVTALTKDPVKDYLCMMLM